MTIYKINTEAGVMYASVNLVQASSSIMVYFGTDPLHDTRYDNDPRYDASSDNDGLSWESTPYQTADAAHREGKMAELVAHYHDMGEVLDVEIVEEG